MRHYIPVALTFFLVFVGSANAQWIDTGAQYHAVTDGIFALSEGQTIDLTDQNLIAALGRNQRGCLAIILGGRKDCIEIGKRYDLKWKHAPFHLKNMFESRRVCFLDVLETQEAAGALATATFRLKCE